MDDESLERLRSSIEEDYFEVLMPLPTVLSLTRPRHLPVTCMQPHQAPLLARYLACADLAYV